MLIYEEARKAVGGGVPVGGAGVLVDEQLGAAVARRAKADGFVLAIPVEKGGTALPPPMKRARSGTRLSGGSS